MPSPQASIHRASPYHLLVFRVLFGLNLACFWLAYAPQTHPNPLGKFRLPFALCMALLSILMAFGFKQRTSSSLLLVGTIFALPTDFEGQVGTATLLFLLVALGFWAKPSPKTTPPKSPSFFEARLLQAIPYASMFVALVGMGYHQFWGQNPSILGILLLATGFLCLLLFPKKPWGYLLLLANVLGFLPKPTWSWVVLALGLSHTSHVLWLRPRHNNLTVLYDGTCNLCRRSVYFLNCEDINKKLDYKTLQGEAAKKPLTTLVVLSPEGKTYTRLEAAAQLGILLGGLWQSAALFYLLPKTWRRRLYEWIAKNRHRWFKNATCTLNNPETH